MVETYELEQIIIDNHIIKKFACLPETVLGYYHYDGWHKIILINEILKQNERLYRIVLAEEIGHYFTTIGDATPLQYCCYRDKLIIDKKELMAVKWAVDYLIPNTILLDMLKEKNNIDKHYLSDEFYVTEKFIIHKFEFMAKQKPIWDIDDKRCLYLYKLPSVFIIEKFSLFNF